MLSLSYHGVPFLGAAWFYQPDVMLFSETDLLTGHFSHEQLLLLKELWDQPHLEIRPLIVKPFILDSDGTPTDAVDDSQQFYAVRGITNIWQYQINGWLLISQNGEEKLLFHSGEQSFFRKYFIVRD